jgi:cytochrome b involved in lipid metabolism
MPINQKAIEKMLETLQNFVSNVSTTTNSWLYSTWEEKTPTSSLTWKNSQQYTLSEVSEHCHLNDCWIVVYDRVYDVTDFLYEVSDRFRVSYKKVIPFKSKIYFKI